MATPLLATSSRRETVPVLAALTLGLAVTAAVRLDTSGRIDLALAAASCVVIGSAVSRVPSSLGRAFGAFVIAVAAGIALARSLLNIEGLALDASIWMLVVLGVGCRTQNRMSLARFLLMSSAGVAFALPLLIDWVGAPPPGEAVQMLASVTACLAFGCALLLTPVGSITSRPGHSMMPGWLPQAALCCVAGTTAIAATLSTDRAWTALTILTVASIVLVESVLPPGHRNGPVSVFPDRLVLPSGIAAIVGASALTVASISSGAPLGWPVAGASAVALLTLTVLAKDFNARSGVDLERLRNSTKESRTDALTGIANRRGFDERLDEEIARAARYGHPLSVLMIDIDDFKLVNDRLGHTAGDQALQAVSTVIERSIRTIDIAARYGGEEFVVILPETPLDGAAIVAERIRAGSVENAGSIPVTLSIGVAELDDTDAAPGALLDRADAALYRAKRSGKNRVELVR